MRDITEKENNKLKSSKFKIKTEKDDINHSSYKEKSVSEKEYQDFTNRY